jgi:hypothetical protein
MPRLSCCRGALGPFSQAGGITSRRLGGLRSSCLKELSGASWTQTISRMLSSEPLFEEHGGYLCLPCPAACQLARSYSNCLHRWFTRHFCVMRPPAAESPIAGLSETWPLFDVTVHQLSILSCQAEGASPINLESTLLQAATFRIWQLPGRIRTKTGGV